MTRQLGGGEVKLMWYKGADPPFHIKTELDSQHIMLVSLFSPIPCLQLSCTEKLIYFQVQCPRKGTFQTERKYEMESGHLEINKTPLSTCTV